MPPVVSPPVTIPPAASTVIIWTIPTKFDMIRCLAWEERESRWRLVVVFGQEILKTEVVSDLDTLWGAAELLRRALTPFDFMTFRPPAVRSRS